MPKPLNSVTFPDLQAYQNRLDEAGLAPASQARAISTVRLLFSFAKRIGYLALNPAEILDVPRVSVNSDGHFLTLAEVHRLLGALKPRKRDYLLVGLALKTGLRVSELAVIKWCHFFTDIDGNVGLRVVGKGDKPRTVKVTPDTWAAVKDYRQSLELPTDPDYTDQSPFFLNRYGGALSPVSMWKILKSSASGAGINKRISPHWLRHTHGTLAIIGGATLSQVREALGHEDLRTTQRYEHSAKALLDTAADHVGLLV